MNEVLSRKFLEKSNENIKLYEFLAKEDCFLEWQAVSIFYSALCYVKAYFYKKLPITEKAINSHNLIKAMLVTDATTRKLMIYEKYYSYLYNKARDARYICKKIKQPVIDEMIKKYNELKSYLIF